jgi:HAMP domain-containing protein
MLFLTFWKNLKIGTKFNLLLMVIFVVGISFSGAALSSVLQQKAQDEIVSKASTLMQTANSVRNYTQDHINPLLLPRLGTEAEFIPEAIPTFSVREVFEIFRKSEDYKDFFYKDAALNPTNLRDKADPFETKLVENFRSNSELKEVSGFRNFPEGKLFYIARPFAITQQKCLQCHSTIDIAPKSLLATYGREHGFGWKLNEVVAAQIVSVPAEAVFASAHRSFALVMGLLMGIFALIILLINFLLRKTVIQRIQKISKTAQAVSTGDMGATFTENSQDEIGSLAIAFNRMKSSLEVAMRLLKK